MPKNLLIYGGYNWVGFELIHNLLIENSFKHFVIVDSFQNRLWKDEIKTKFDEYRYLYNENIHLYNIDIKDGYKLENIYKKYNITHVINNIKYNMNDEYHEEKEQGFRNIMQYNISYNVLTYICMYRHITHNTFALNYNTRNNYVNMCKKFNESIQKINEEEQCRMNIVHIPIYDYVFGFKKDKYNEIVTKYKRIIKTQTPCRMYKYSCFMQYDEDIINHMLCYLLDLAPVKELKVRKYSYLSLYDTIYFHVTNDPTYNDNIITHDNNLINYIKMDMKE